MPTFPFINVNEKQIIKMEKLFGVVSWRVLDSGLGILLALGDRIYSRKPHTKRFASTVMPFGKNWGRKTSAVASPPR